MARVLLDTPVPHLDREFDYLVPPALDARAVPGSRVTVRFGGREMTGWLVARVAQPSTGAQLTALSAVPAAIPPLTEEVLAAARAVAARQAGVATGVYLNNRKVTIYGGTSEVQHNILSKAVLGM